MAEEKVDNQDTTKQPEQEKDTAIENTPEVEPQEPNEVPEELVEDEDVVVTIGEETPPQEEEKETPQWVKDLRKQNKETNKRLKELEKENKELKGGDAKEVTLRKKPKLEDFDYDSDAFEADLDKWIEQRDEVKKLDSKKEESKKAEKQEWQNTLDSYNKKKEVLKVPDFDETEELVVETFSEAQQGILLVSAENPALVAYALGKNASKLKELSLIKDHIKFAAAVARLETTLKVSNRKKAPKPETIVAGGGSSAGTVDSTLERLRAEGSKSGDMSKVIAYKAQLKKKKRG